MKSLVSILFVCLFAMMIAAVFSSAVLAEEDEEEPPPPPHEMIQEEPPENPYSDSPSAAEVLSGEAELGDFEGTLADDDWENEELKKEEEMFGEGDELVDAYLLERTTHLLTFEFKSHVKFLEHLKRENGETYTSGEPYLELEYKTVFEANLNLIDARQSAELVAQVQNNTWGSLARNEFFDCRLEVELAQLPATLVTKVITEKPEEGEEKPEEPLKTLNLKIAFSKAESGEDWFSLCTATSGGTLNTQGDQEHWNLKLLKEIQPDLSGVVVENFISYEDTVIDLSVSEIIEEDLDIANDVILSGEGRITIEAL